MGETMALTFDDGMPRYDSARMAVLFTADDSGRRILCYASREALDDLAGVSSDKGSAGYLQIFARHRGKFEAAADQKYRAGATEGGLGETVIVTTADVND
jgi:hypothetical protein